MEISWQSASSYFLEGAEFAYTSPQIWNELFSALIVAPMKSCHNYFFKLCTIQRYLTLAAAKFLAHALFIPQSATPGCLSRSSARIGLLKRDGLFQGFFVFSFFLTFMLICYLVSLIAFLYLKIIIF